MEKITEALEAQGVSANLLKEIAAFRAHYPVEEALQNRVTAPDMPYYGRETFEMAAYALLQGENILLTGSKATGKIFWRKILRGCSADPPTTCPFMSTWIAVRLWAQIHFAAVKYSCGRVLCISAR